MALIVAVLMLVVTGIQLLPEGRPIEAADQVTFAIIGDFGSELQSELDVSQMVESWNPSFIGTTGDNVYTADNVDGFSALDRKIGRYYHDFIYPYYGGFGSGSPTGTNRFFPALGNHDWGDPGTPMLTCNGQNCAGPWADFFTLPGNERYYDHREGPVHLFVVDDYYLEPDGHKSDSVQANWLRTSLAASDAQWKIVLTHFAPQASVGARGRESIRWPFKEWGATMVVSGHHHFYERLNVDGMIYAVNGLGGAGIGGFGPTHPNSIIRYNADHGAMRLVATESQLTTEFIATNGTLVDRFVLSEDPPPPPTTTTTQPTTTTTARPTTTSTSIVDAPVTTVAGSNPYAGSEGRQGSLVRLYAAAFGRLPDQEGLTHWQDSGLSISDIAYHFVVSTEFNRRYGAVTDPEFVELLYNNVLGRQPDAAGMTYWTDLLDSGETHVAVLLGFSESDEFKAKTDTR